MIDMTGKTVLITGASRGIGEAAAHVFSAAGANVVLAARSAERVTQIAAQIGDNARGISCDVSEWAQVEAAVALAVGEFGGLDVLINNAGAIEPISHLHEADPLAWGKVIDINLKGVFYGMRAAIPVMPSGGTILTISSGAAHGPVEAWSHYCSSKAAAAMLTRCADKEAGIVGSGLRVMGLSPGTVATEMQREIKSSGVNPVSQLDWEVHIPADWPARALLWMCSDDADEFLGQEISLRDEGIRRRAGLIA